MAKCRQCGADLIAGAKFCMECGAKVPAVCKQCGAELVEGAKFCMNCGTPVNGDTTKGASLISGDANAISAHDIINGNQINAGTYVVNNHPEVFAASDVNVEKLLERAINYYDDENYKKAFDTFMKIADRDMEAQWYLGSMYCEGDGVKQNYDKARQYYEQSAINGYSDAYLCLAKMLLNKEYGPIDVTKAIHYLEKVVDSNADEEANQILATIYCIGYHVDKKLEKASELAMPIYKNAVQEDSFYGCNGIAAMVVAIITMAEGHDIKHLNLVLPTLSKCFECLDYEDLLECEQAVVNEVRNIFGYFETKGASSFTIAEGTPSILAFAKNPMLKEITIPGSVLLIGENAFEECTSLKEIIYTGTKQAWMNCKCSHFPDSMMVVHCSDGDIKLMRYKSTYMGGTTKYENCISDKDKLIEVEIQDNVTSIEEDEFENCFALRSVTIPNSITSIGEDAFWGCSSLQSVTIPNSVTSIGGHAFRACEVLESITIPNSVTSIGTYAFCDCSLLKSITIPNSIRFIGEWAFYDCDSLSVVFDGTKQEWNNRGFTNISKNIGCIHCSDGDIIFKKYKLIYADGTIKYENKGDSNIIEVEIQDNVTSIDKNAFRKCSLLKSVTIPSSVTSIEEGAFWCCSLLQSVTIPSSVTSIGEDAFWGCSTLQSVTIPNSVTSIGGKAFCSCSALKSIVIPNSVSVIGRGVFDYCDNLKVIVLIGTKQEWSNRVDSLPQKSAVVYCTNKDKIESLRKKTEEAVERNAVHIAEIKTSLVDIFPTKVSMWAKFRVRDVWEQKPYVDLNLNLDHFKTICLWLQSMDVEGKDVSDDDIIRKTREVCAQ